LHEVEGGQRGVLAGVDVVVVTEPRQDARGTFRGSDGIDLEEHAGPVTVRAACAFYRETARNDATQ
jgi:hypothetical protein